MLASFAFAKETAPPEGAVTNVHVPMPAVGVLPAKVAEFAHTFWVVPAFAMVGLAKRVIFTLLVVEGQGTFTIVQVRI